VSSVRANDLLKHFKSPQRIFNSSEKELQEVKGIGDKIAKKIKEVIENQY
jgi:ERCC4-type nuclease